MKCTICGCDRRMLCYRCREGRCTRCAAPRRGWMAFVVVMATLAAMLLSTLAAQAALPPPPLHPSTAAETLRDPARLKPAELKRTVAEIEGRLWMKLMIFGCEEVDPQVVPVGPSEFKIELRCTVWNPLSIR